MTRAARQAVGAEGPRVTAPLGAGRPLPAGWRWVRLGDVCEITARQVDPRIPEFGKLPHVNGENVESGTCRLAGVKTAAEDGLISGKYLFEPGDVLYSKLRPYLRKVVVAEFRGVCSADMYPIRVKLDVDPRFLAWTLLSRDFTEYADRESRRARMPKLNRDQLFSWTCSLPPINEQRRIVAQLDEQMAAVERARAAAEAQLEAATRLPSSCLQAQFDAAGTQAWPRRRVKEVAVLLPSKSISTNGDFEVIAVTTACLAEAGFLPAGAKPARMWAQDAAQCVISRGEVLVARSNTPDLVGRVAMFDGEPRGAVASDLTVRIQTREDLMPEFLTRYLSFLYLTGYWKDRAGGASGSMKKITRGQIESERVPVPAIEIQQQVVAALKDRMAEAGRIRKHLEDELAAINALPAALLRRAFSGAL